MDAMDAILTRHSIRNYTDKIIPDEEIENLLRAGMSAPSAGDERPWHFIVIRDRSILDAIPRIHPYSHMLKEANVAIVVCGDTNALVHEGYWVQDCSAAAENILIAANALGLGAVWLGVYPTEVRVHALQKLFGLPESVYPLCIIPVGYPSVTRKNEDRLDKTRIHQNKW